MYAYIHTYIYIYTYNQIGYWMPMVKSHTSNYAISRPWAADVQKARENAHGAVGISWKMVDLQMGYEWVMNGLSIL